VAAAVFAWWWLAERLSPAQWIGAALVLAGIVLAEVRRPPNPAAPPSGL
jgi:drug/metabolite transporter (DMT)-like permease